MVQEIIVLAIVFGAAIYALWATVRSVRKKSSGACGDNCACSAKTDFRKAMLKKQHEIKADSIKMIR